MKPTTQAKTTNQLVNQITALEEILKSVIAGAKELRIKNAQSKYARREDPSLQQALDEATRAMAVAHDIAVSANTEVYRAKEKERNTKYSYHRKAYRVLKADEAFSVERAAKIRADGYAALKTQREIDARIAKRNADDRANTEAALKEMRLHQQLREDNAEQARMAREIFERRNAGRLAPKVDYVPNASEPDEVPY